MLSLSALTLQIIDRGGRLGVRLKDMKNPGAGRVQGHPLFSRSTPRFRVVATFVPQRKAGLAPWVPNVLGMVESMPSPGYASFVLDGGNGKAQPLRLDAVLEPGETELFFIFSDPTAGKTTYGARPVPVRRSARNGKVILDFNRAYSPPCAFTPHATCPLPPPNNRLPVAIEAGEMFAGHH